MKEVADSQCDRDVDDEASYAYEEEGLDRR
jgi:hypothetical protein